MSRRAVSTGLEGIDRISGRGGADIGFEAVAVYHVDGAVKQARDVILQGCIGEHGDMRLRIYFDHDVDIAVRSAVATRDRAEHGRPAHAARAEIGFGSPQGFKGFGTVHKSKYSTNSGWGRGRRGDGGRCRGLLPQTYPSTNSFRR